MAVCPVLPPLLLACSPWCISVTNPAALTVHTPSCKRWGDEWARLPSGPPPPQAGEATCGQRPLPHHSSLQARAPRSTNMLGARRTSPRRQEGPAAASSLSLQTPGLSTRGSARTVARIKQRGHKRKNCSHRVGAFHISPAEM